MTEPQLQGKALQASLTVKDLDRSLAWYTETFGFAISRRIEREGRLVGVALQAGQVAIIINQDDGAKGRDRVKGQGMSFYVPTEQEIDALARRIKSHGGTLEKEPEDMPWGARIFKVRDPDGFLWVIARQLAG